MLSVILFALTYYPDDLKENLILNSCDFNIIRFNKKDIMCTDYNYGEKYCNIYYLPYEFTITKELGVGNKINYNIEPKAIFQDYYRYYHYKDKFCVYCYCEHLNFLYQAYILNRHIRMHLLN